ncbi:MAG: T9SS type A sorting domain-containing protein [Ignavibacteriaceae bacterium]|nr:T9SS type A sorting domain-containing protein [Ignavibacteriaceae bacterium]
MKTFFTFFLFLLFSVSISAQEDIMMLVVPSDYTSTPGTGQFSSQFYTTPRTYQLLIHQDLLTSLIGQEIKAVSWRLPTGATENWPPTDITITNWDLYLSGSVDPALRSLTDFSANVVGPQKMVRSGSLFIPANSYTFGNTPNNWGPEITFDSLYLYTGGNLLIEMQQTGFTSTSRSVDALTASTPGYGTMFSACYGNGYPANSGSQGNFSIVRLTADDPVPVELTSFSASVISNNVILEWTTATEINNYGFEVERKSENSGYEMVGFVSGSGSTTELRNYSFTDDKVGDGSYVYRLKQIDFDGSFYFSDEVEVEVIAPAVFALDQNYPNPFNPSTTINFSIAEASVVKIAVYNLLGQEVALLLDEFKEAGPHTITFDASSLTSGAYFYSIQTPLFKQTKKMLLAK